jgi:uncharacterized protein YaaW (UPF0174 family)
MFKEKIIYILRNWNFEERENSLNEVLKNEANHVLSDELKAAREIYCDEKKRMEVTAGNSDIVVEMGEKRKRWEEKSEE